jgi:putative membrane protein
MEEARTAMGAISFASISFASMIFWTLLTPGGAFAAGPFGTIRVPTWQGGAFTDDQTGVFSHCAASASYQDGNSLVVGQKAEGEWMIGFTNPSWTMAKGEAVPLDIAFDGKAPFHLTGIVTGLDAVTSALPIAALDQFGRSSSMTVAARSQTFQFVLYSSEKLAPAIKNCVDKAKLNGVTITAYLRADKVSQVFIRDAIQSGLAEIQLAELAKKNSQNDEVKSYAETLVADDSTLNEQAKKIAEQIGTSAPTAPSVKQKSTYDEMAKLSGAAFDRAFAKEMVAGPKLNILRFQNEAKKQNDPVADFANQTLPTMQKHLDAAQKLSQSLTFE